MRYTPSARRRPLRVALARRGAWANNGCDGLKLPRVRADCQVDLRQRRDSRSLGCGNPSDDLHAVISRHGAAYAWTVIAGGTTNGGMVGPGVELSNKAT